MIPSAYQALKVIDECDEPPLPRCLEGIKTSWEIPSKKGGQLSLFGSQKKIHLKKNHQFFEEPSPPPKKKHHSSLTHLRQTWCCNTANVPPKPCEFHHFLPMVSTMTFSTNGSSWALTRPTFGTAGAGGESAALSCQAMENGVPPTPPVSTFSKMYITTFFRNSKKNN